MSPDDPSAVSASNAEPIKATWTYTRAEMRAYQRLVFNVRGAYGSDFIHPFYFRYIVVVLSVLAGLAAWLTGAVPDIKNPTVPLLCAVVYYLARAVEDWFRSRHYRQVYQADLDDFLGPTYTIAIDDDGFILGGRHARYIVEWPRLRRVQETKGLLLFWMFGSNAYCVPTRVFSPEDLMRVRALVEGKAARRGQ